MIHAFLIFVGGGAGAVCRHYFGLASLRLLGPGFPFGTLGVNIVGSLLMGLLIGYFLKSGSSENYRLLVATRFLGGFTTFSAFSLDFANLWMRGSTAEALGYAAISVVCSILAVFVGLMIMRGGTA